MRLERAREDLARARRTLVDDHDQRKVLEHGALRLRAHLPDLVAIAILARHDLAAVHEHVRELDRALEQTTGIEAEVEDEAIELALGTHVRDRGHEVLEAVVVEAAQTDVADAVLGIDVPVPLRRAALVERLLPPAVDGADLDLLADERDIDVILLALALDGQRDGLAGGACDRVDRLVERPAERRLAVDGDDAVVVLDARAERRSALERVDDLDVALVVVTDHDADADEVALDHLLEAAELLRPDDLRVLVLEASREFLDRAVAELTEEHGRGQVRALLVGLEDVAERRVELRLADRVAVHVGERLDVAVHGLEEDVGLLLIAESREVLLERAGGREHAHGIETALDERLPAAGRDVLVGSGVERADEHALGDAVERLLPVVGKRLIERRNRLARLDALGVRLAEFVQLTRRVLREQRDALVDLVELGVVAAQRRAVARLLVQSLEAVQDLLRDHPVAGLLRLVFRDLGLLDELDDLGHLQRRLHVVGEGLEPHGGGERLGELLLLELGLEVLERLGAVGGTGLVARVDVLAAGGDQVAKTLRLGRGARLGNLLERSLDGREIAALGGVPHAVRPAGDVGILIHSGNGRREEGASNEKPSAEQIGWANETVEGESGLHAVLHESGVTAVSISALHTADRTMSAAHSDESGRRRFSTDG